MIQICNGEEDETGDMTAMSVVDRIYRNLFVWDEGEIRIIEEVEKDARKNRRDPKNVNLPLYQN